MKRLLAITLLFCGCTDDDRTIMTLRKSGYTNISTTGYSFLECGEDDTFHTGFVATNSSGQRVTGTVCCGLLLKGCTLRF